MAYLFKDSEDKDRIPQLEKEIHRLQELCRNNFGVIADLKRENEKLTEIQMELKETTSDLGYSLAEYPWWGDMDHDHTLNALQVLVTYTKNIQYILQLPIFFDPVEQLTSYGLNRDKAIGYLKMRYCGGKGGRKCFKCPKCKKEFTSEDRRKKHLQFHDNMKKKLHCSQCNKYIQSFPSFKSHLQSHEFTNRMMAFPPITFLNHTRAGPIPEESISAGTFRAEFSLPAGEFDEEGDCPSQVSPEGSEEDPLCENIAREEFHQSAMEVEVVEKGKGHDGEADVEGESKRKETELCDFVLIP